MRRHPTLPALLSLALILAVSVLPAAAQAAPSAAANPPAGSVLQAPPPVFASQAVMELTFDNMSPVFGMRTCSTKTVPFAAPAVFCPHCPPGKVSCGYPLCRCCGGEL
jgi:hypothetical protein